MGCFDGLILGENRSHLSLADRHEFVFAHVLPFAVGLDLSRLEEVEDAEAVTGFTNRLKADWAGHFGYSPSLLELLVPF